RQASQHAEGTGERCEEQHGAAPLSVKPHRYTSPIRDDTGRKLPLLRGSQAKIMLAAARPAESDAQLLLAVEPARRVHDEVSGPPVLGIAVEVRLGNVAHQLSRG